MGDDPKWLADMRSHYASTGSYRVEDIRRVLGDPLEPVTMEQTNDRAHHHEGNGTLRSKPHGGATKE